MMRKRPPAVHTALWQDDDDHSSQEEYHMGSSTYRQEGISIGPDYLRLEGATVTRGELLPSSLQVCGTLGKGACSVVLKANWTRQGEKERTAVALKQFPIHSSNQNKQRRRMLLKELKALGRIDCECLVSLFGAFLDEDTVTLVLEYMDRGSLSEVLKSRAVFPEAVLGAISYQLIWGLSYLHFERMTHRDVKSDNVLLHSNGSVKLSDFGLVAIHEEHSMNTTIVGTVRYMAPERLRKQTYGTASDIWSLGLVLLESAIGERPWRQATSMVELVLDIEDTLSSSDWIPNTVPPGLREILASCLQEEPQKRIPARVLLKSPWFQSLGIRSVQDAIAIMKDYHIDPINGADSA